MLSLPEFQVIQGTCECITEDKAPPPLIPVSRNNWFSRIEEGEARILARDFQRNSTERINI
jgi:hypothetical protein